MSQYPPSVTFKIIHEPPYEEGNDLSQATEAECQTCGAIIPVKNQLKHQNWHDTNSINKQARYYYVQDPIPNTWAGTGYKDYYDEVAKLKDRIKALEKKSSATDRARADLDRRAQQKLRAKQGRMK